MNIYNNIGLSGVIGEKGVVLDW